MKKIVWIGLILAACLMVFCACVNSDTTASAAPSLSQTSAESTAALSPKPIGISASSAAPCETDMAFTGETDTVLSDEPDTAPAKETDADGSPGSVIIAESSNTVSDKEKRAMLGDLSKQIEIALGGLEALEDVDDSDLSIDDTP